MKKSFVFTFLVALILILAQPGFSQTVEETKSLRDEINALKEGQTAIQKDLQEIKNLLRAKQAQPQAPPEFKEAILQVDDRPFKGDKNAKLAIIDFSDYQ